MLRALLKLADSWIRNKPSKERVAKVVQYKRSDCFFCSLRILRLSAALRDETTCTLKRASSTGRCNTIQCIDSTLLARENQLFGCARPKPSQGLAVGTGRTYRKLIGHTSPGPQLASLHSLLSLLINQVSFTQQGTVIPEGNPCTH
jgi:hypothetical protein